MTSDAQTFTAAELQRMLDRQGAHAFGRPAESVSVSLATNAIPIAAGIALFRQPLPQGPLVTVQLVAYTLVVVGAALLVRAPAPSHLRVPAPSKPDGTFDSK